MATPIREVYYRHPDPAQALPQEQLLVPCLEVGRALYHKDLALPDHLSVRRATQGLMQNPFLALSVSVVLLPA